MLLIFSLLFLVSCSRSDNDVFGETVSMSGDGVFINEIKTKSSKYRESLWKFHYENNRIREILDEDNDGFEFNYVNGRLVNVIEKYSDGDIESITRFYYNGGRLIRTETEESYNSNYGNVVSVFDLEYEGNKLSKVIERKNKRKPNDVITRFYYNGNVINRRIVSIGSNTETTEFVYGQENAPHKNWKFEERFFINFLIEWERDRLALNEFAPFSNNNVLEMKFTFSDGYGSSNGFVLKWYYNIYNLNKYPTGCFAVVNMDNGLREESVSFSFKY